MINKEKYKAQYAYKERNKEKIREYQAAYSRKTRTNIRYRWSRVKSRCNKDNRKFRIAFQTYKKMIEGGCYYCGEELLTNKGGGLDRVNNENRNYTTRNVVACCTRCNDLKNYQLSKDETKYVVTQLKKYRKKNGISVRKTKEEARRKNQKGKAKRLD